MELSEPKRQLLLGISYTWTIYFFNVKCIETGSRKVVARGVGKIERSWLKHTNFHQ